MAKGQGKGSEFERHVSKLLSLWWTNGERDDVFWRTDNSGGRAKTRKKQAGKSTFGQYGDIQAADPIGQPLINLCTIEVKKGYNRNTIGDVLDRGPQNAEQPWERFTRQAFEDHRNSGTPYWLLITKRDARNAIIFMPLGLYTMFRTIEHCTLSRARPWLLFRSKRRRGDCPIGPVFGTNLEEFLTRVSPAMVKRGSGNGNLGEEK